MFNLSEYRYKKLNKVDDVLKKHDDIIEKVNKDVFRMKNGLPSNITTDEYLGHISDLCNMCLMIH